MIEVKVINDSQNQLPEYATAGSAGLDLRADFSKGFNEDLMHLADYDEVRKCLLIFSGGRVLIPTNLKTSIPEGYEAQIRPRSGTAIKNGVTVLNTPGTIDSDYRNYWGVILFNTGDDVFEVYQGDRIAQVVFSKYEQIVWKDVTNLDVTSRADGFGHTGVK